MNIKKYFLKFFEILLKELFDTNSNDDLKIISNKKSNLVNVDFISSSKYKENEKPLNNVLCLSGGGSRSFLLSMVIMRELENKNKINSFDLIGSVSGGSWANCMFQYGKYRSREEYLGKSILPENLSQETINNISSNCVLSCVNNNLIEYFENSILKESKNINIKDLSLSDIWSKIINAFYLNSFSVDGNKFHLNKKKELTEVLTNQPNLNEDDFILPQSKYPPALFMCTIAGPKSLSPYNVDKNSNFTIYEMNHKYSGIYYAPDNGNITYQNEKNNKSKKIEVEGYINSQAFNGFLQKDKQTVLLDKKGSILDTISLSSWAPGSFLDSLPIQSDDRDIYFEKNFINKKENNNFLFTDGATINNHGIIPMVQRKVKNIFACINSKSKFTYYIDKQNNYTTSNIPIDFTFATLFGVITNSDLSYVSKKSNDFTNTHIFETKYFNKLIDIMNKVEKKGNGIVCSIEVETIENKWYNIKAGNKINLTIFYNSLPINWYNKLDSDLQQIVDNKNLPFIPTKAADISADEINLIDSMTSWTINSYIDNII